MYQLIKPSINALFAILVLFTSPALFANSSIDGRWQTIDDETQKPKSIVEITTTDGEVTGKIVKLFNPSTPNPVCTRCKGERKDQPIQGMVIMWGLSKKAEDRWTRGKILDPKKGKIYKLRVTAIEGGQKLKVRGFIGASFIGRTQIWKRMP